MAEIDLLMDNRDHYRSSVAVPEGAIGGAVGVLLQGDLSPGGPPLR
jgi:hypothetical protein